MRYQYAPVCKFPEKPAQTLLGQTTNAQKNRVVLSENILRKHADHTVTNRVGACA